MTCFFLNLTKYLLASVSNIYRYKKYTKAVYSMYHIGVNMLSFLLESLFALHVQDHMIEAPKHTDILHNLIIQLKYWTIIIMLYYIYY